MSLWTNLQKRERVVVALGGVLILMLLVYTILVVPLHNDFRQMQESIQRSKVELKWMQEAAVKVGALSVSGAGKSALSPLKIIDRTAGKFGITANLRKVDPSEDDKIKVWFEGLAFVDLVKFIRVIGFKHQIVISSLTVERLDKSGLVNARVTLKTGAI